MNESKETIPVKIRITVPETIVEKKKKPYVSRMVTLSDYTPDFILTALEWFFRKEKDEEDVKGQWWVLRKESAHLPIVMGIFVFLICVPLYFSGFFHFVFRKGYVQDDLISLKGTCSGCINVVNVFDFPDEVSKDWMRSLPSVPSLGNVDGQRGWFTIKDHWEFDRPVNVSFRTLRPIMAKDSEGGRCDCALQHGIPVDTFAFNGTVYVAHQFSGVRGSSVSCKMSGIDANGERFHLQVSAASTGVVRYWNDECSEVRADASHALMCCAHLCQVAPKNLLR